jgi:hypothetical protein
MLNFLFDKKFTNFVTDQRSNAWVIIKIYKDLLTMNDIINQSISQMKDETEAAI